MEVDEIQANFDDLDNRITAYLMEKLFERGAYEVFFTPVYMKKNRPGVLLTVVSPTDKTDSLIDIIFKETTTIGLRIAKHKKIMLERRTEKVKTKFGEVEIKVAELKGKVVNYSPEYESCKTIAKEKNVPLKEVLNEAVRVYKERVKV